MILSPFASTDLRLRFCCYRIDPDTKKKKKSKSEKPQARHQISFRTSNVLNTSDRDFIGVEGKDETIPSGRLGSD